MSSYLLSLFAITATLVSAASSVPVTGKTYTISPASHSDLCVVPKGDWDGARLAIESCDGSDDIAWIFDGQSLKNTATNRCVDVLDGGHWNGNGLQAWTCFDHNTNQRFNSRSGGIQWQDTGMCLDLTDGRSDPGTYLQLWQCFDGNTNQQWLFDEVEEVEDCEETTSVSPVAPSTTMSSASMTSASMTSAAPSASVAPSASASAEADQDCEEDGDEDEDEDDEECDAEETASATSVSAYPSASNSTIGGGLWAGEKNSSVSASASVTASNSWETASASANVSASATSADAWETASASANVSASATSAESWETASASASSAGSWESASASSSVPVPSASASTNNGDMSGYLQVSGTQVIDPSGKTVQLRGTNLGGWLVWEDWMCGINDNSGTHDRFPQSTLERRFGEDKTRDLMKVWQDNWLIESDFDKLAAFGFNVLRLPFSYRNFVRSDGSWITDSNGNLDLSRLDWAIAQAKKRGMYVIPTFHIWEGQEQKYSTISEDTWEGKQQRDKTGALWTVIAKHFQGETAIAAFDAINEPTGSANNNLQRDLYHAIRAGDSKRIIIMESISNSPDSDWTNVMYSMHEYLMMGENDDGYNQWMFEQGPRKDTKQYTSVGVPTYIGEFMASGNTLTWMLDQLNKMHNSEQTLWWSAWSFKSVNRDRWALYNFGDQMYVDVSSDSYESIRATWSNMGGVSKSRIADQYAAAVGGTAASWKRDETKAVEQISVSVTERVNASPRVGASSRMRRLTPHAGRSRRGLQTAHSLKL